MNTKFEFGQEVNRRLCEACSGLKEKDFSPEYNFAIICSS